MTSLDIIIIFYFISDDYSYKINYKFIIIIQVSDIKLAGKRNSSLIIISEN